MRLNTVYFPTVSRMRFGTGQEASRYPAFFQPFYDALDRGTKHIITPVHILYQHPDQSVLVQNIDEHETALILLKGEITNQEQVLAAIRSQGCPKLVIHRNIWGSPEITDCTYHGGFEEDLQSFKEGLPILPVLERWQLQGKLNNPKMRRR